MVKKTQPESPVTKQQLSVAFGKFFGIELDKKQYTIMAWVLGIGILITAIWMIIMVVDFIGEVFIYLVLMSTLFNASVLTSLNGFIPMITSIILFWILIISRILLKKVKFA